MLVAESAAHQSKCERTGFVGHFVRFSWGQLNPAVGVNPYFQD